MQLFLTRPLEAQLKRTVSISSFRVTLGSPAAPSLAQYKQKVRDHLFLKLAPTPSLFSRSFFLSFILFVYFSKGTKKEVRFREVTPSSLSAENNSQEPDSYPQTVRFPFFPPRSGPPRCTIFVCSVQTYWHRPLTAEPLILAPALRRRADDVVPIRVLLQRRHRERARG